MSPHHDQSQISTCLDGSLTVATYTKHRWLRDFPKTLDRCDISVELGKTSKKSFGVSPQAFRGSDPFTVHCHLVRSGAPGQRSETQLTSAARFTVKSPPVLIRQRHARNCASLEDSVGTGVHARLP
jgi:hypothetical protein